MVVSQRLAGAGQPVVPGELGLFLVGHMVYHSSERAITAMFKGDYKELNTDGSPLAGQQYVTMALPGVTRLAQRSHRHSSLSVQDSHKTVLQTLPLILQS